MTRILIIMTISTPSSLICIVGAVTSLGHRSPSRFGTSPLDLWRAVTTSLDALRIAVTASFAVRVTSSSGNDSPMSPPLSLLPLSYIHFSTTSFNYIFPLIKPWESKDSGLRVFIPSPNFTFCYSRPFARSVAFQQLLEPASIPISLRQFAIDKGFTENVRGDHTLHVGVDARYVWGNFSDRLLSFTGKPGQ